VTDSAVEQGNGHVDPVRVAVYVCTFRRNGPLRTQLESLASAAAHSSPRIAVGVVVVDDNADGRARAVVDDFPADSFVLGLHYRYSGAENISMARNTGIDAALEIGDWVAMTDDDQTVVQDWFDALVDTADRTGADAVTGPVVLRNPPQSGRWLTDQPFDRILASVPVPDGERVELCSTGNSMISARFLREHPDLRFRPDLGVLGGEDGIFFRAAVQRGLHARNAARAVSYLEQEPHRGTRRYVLRTCYWMGNTQFIVNRRSYGTSRIRLAARGGRRIADGLLHPIRRLRAGGKPEFHFAAGRIAEGLGLWAGALGIEVSHH
jgi:succinoglycan biosynthesis protein ExoM